MTTATREAIERLRQLSAAEIEEVARWLSRHHPTPAPIGDTGAAAFSPVSTAGSSAHIQRPDFATRLEMGWGPDAPALLENAVLSLRAEERS